MILIDGNNLYARYYARLGFMVINNCNVGGMFGFLRNLYSLSKKFNDNILVIWDGKNGKDVRRRICPEYKRNRTFKFDDNFLSSKEELFNVLKNYCGIPEVKMDNWEADDIIGYIVNAITNFSSTLKDEHIYIVSNDKDFWQLISDKVFIVMKDKIFGLPELEKETGCISGKEFLACRVLAGDPSDNIIGAEKIGLKRALKIVRSGKTNIDVYKDIIEKNMELMRLDNKLIEVDFIHGKTNLEEYICWCMKYTFKTLVEDAEDFIANNTRGNNRS